MILHFKHQYILAEQRMKSELQRLLTTISYTSYATSRDNKFPTRRIILVQLQLPGKVVTHYIVTNLWYIFSGQLSFEFHYIDL